MNLAGSIWKYTRAAMSNGGGSGGSLCPLYKYQTRSVPPEITDLMAQVLISIEEHLIANKEVARQMELNGQSIQRIKHIVKKATRL